MIAKDQTLSTVLNRLQWQCQRFNMFSWPKKVKIYLLASTTEHGWVGVEAPLVALVAPVPGSPRPRAPAPATAPALWLWPRVAQGEGEGSLDRRQTGALWATLYQTTKFNL